MEYLIFAGAIIIIMSMLFAAIKYGESRASAKIENDLNKDIKEEEKSLKDYAKDVRNEEYTDTDIDEYL